MEAGIRRCPAYHGLHARHHWPFKDPVRVVGTEEMVLKAFRRARDELEQVFLAYGRGLADGQGLWGEKLPRRGGAKDFPVEDGR